jgi:AmiR/NasT family two-component response regulator
MCSDVRMVVYHEDSATQTAMRQAVESLGHEVVRVGADGDRLVDEVISDESIGLVLCGLKLGNRDAISCLLSIAENRPVPAIVVTDEKSLAEVEKALEDHVMAYLIEPVSAAQLRPTIHLVQRRFNEFQNLKEEVNELRERYEARRTIERAKAVLMKKERIDEDAAYQMLRKSAMDKRSKLIDIANELLHTESAKAEVGTV